MASVKIVLRRKANKDGTFPLALRITKDRKASYIYLGHHLFEEDWNAEKQEVRKSHPNATRLNNLIAKKRAEASDRVIEFDAQDRDTSADGIKRFIAAFLTGYDLRSQSWSSPPFNRIWIVISHPDSGFLNLHP